MINHSTEVDTTLKLSFSMNFQIVGECKAIFQKERKKNKLKESFFLILATMVTIRNGDTAAVKVDRSLVPVTPFTSRDINIDQM